MSCQRFREAIAGHAAGADLSPAAAAHLGLCEACGARLETERRLLAEVDAELARALSLSASPEFVARVTSRAAATNARSIVWRPAAAWVGLAAAAAIIAAAMLRAPVPVVSPAPRESAVAAAAPAPTPTAAEPGAPPSVGSRPGPSRQPAAARPMQEPPVIVGPEQARAIARLRELLSEGRLTAKMLPPAASHETAELTVVPLEIPEIIVPDVEGVARERQ